MSEYQNLEVFAFRHCDNIYTKPQKIPPSYLKAIPPYENRDDFHKICISYKLDTDILYEYNINMSIIANKIHSEYDDMFCVFSPNHIGQLDIFIDTSDIQSDIDNEYLNNFKHDIYIEEVIIPKLNELIICGIEGINDIYYKEHDGKWMIQTDGSNFQKLLSHPKIDMNRLESNNMWDIYHMLGIEAVREFLIDEFIGDKLLRYNFLILIGEGFIKT